ncbi:hypothetical protein DWQ65_11290 [Treponema phagedenis]|uniref:Uncharacterized protein n=1 Tax=Treponema phagedenis TaxID=162 RepID=A0AAE6IS18_TREPH|nr:hypothetical protein FUT79_13035 [Treponema phagedenis]QEJ97264.1 hypothetical protein FUT82_04195 [Treponema phagedenis]QEK01796.1 hypothetical protein FUT84_11960 [Treponema phagedenis]QEK02543.1 hypothetical protein FUT83_01130 [Treponema phagedenis]QEK06909.1 hypothetical protein FUT80_09445 [Treponema phagedenis]
MFCLILQRKQAKLVGEPKVEILRVRPCAVSNSFYTSKFSNSQGLVLTWTSKLRTATDARGSEQKSSAKRTEVHDLVFVVTQT